MAVESELIDKDVDYCDGDDVFAYIRNKTYGDLGANTKPTKSQVDNLISRYSNRVDTYTRRAWRDRKVVGLETRVKLSHKQKHSRHRRRNIRGHGGRHNFGSDPRGMVDLPHIHIKTPDSNQGDAVEVLNPRSIDDITDDRGRGDGRYVVDERKGIIRPDISNFTAIGTRTQGPTVDESLARVRVTYRYGETNDPTDGDTDGVSDTVPGDVREATAQLVASKLIGSDQYGEMVPTGGEGTPSLTDTASTLKNDAYTTLDTFKRV